MKGLRQKIRFRREANRQKLGLCEVLEKIEAQLRWFSPVARTGQEKTPVAVWEIGTRSTSRIGCLDVQLAVILKK